MARAAWRLTDHVPRRLTATTSSNSSGAHVHERAVADDAGVVHDGVDAAEGVDARLHELLCEVIVCDRRRRPGPRCPRRQRSPPTTSRSSSSFVPFTTTCAPSEARATANARPRPRDAPVTTMRLPSTSPTAGERRGTRTAQPLPSPRGHRDDRRSPAPGLGRSHDRAAAIGDDPGFRRRPCLRRAVHDHRAAAGPRMDADGLEDRLHEPHALAALRRVAADVGSGLGPHPPPGQRRTRGARRHVARAAPHRDRGRLLPPRRPTRDRRRPHRARAHRMGRGGVRDRAVPLRELAVRGTGLHGCIRSPWRACRGRPGHAR